MNKHDEEESEQIYQCLVNAIPKGVCYGNVIIALTELAMEVTIIMGEQDDEDNDYLNKPDDEDIFLGGTKYSKN